MNSGKNMNSARRTVLAEALIGSGVAICVCVIALAAIPILVLKDILDIEWALGSVAIIHFVAMLAGGFVAGVEKDSNKYLVVCCCVGLYLAVLISIGMLLFNLSSTQLVKGTCGAAIGALCSIVILKIKKMPVRNKRMKRHYR